MVEIHDEDTTSVRVVEDVRVEEGEEFELTLALDHEVAFNLEVLLRISATDGTGMTERYLEPDETSGQVTSRSAIFPARQRQATLTIGTVEDRVVEAEVSLDVTLLRGVLDDAIALINDPVPTITILDDDVPAWAVSVAPDTIAEAAGTATVTVSTGGVTFAAAQTIGLSFDGGSGDGGDRFHGRRRGREPAHLALRAHPADGRQHRHGHHHRGGRPGRRQRRTDPGHRHPDRRQARRGANDHDHRRRHGVHGDRAGPDPGQRDGARGGADDHGDGRRWTARPGPRRRT